MALTKISTGMLKQDAASSDLNIDAGTLYLDVSNNRVGVATTSPLSKLNVKGSQGNWRIDVDSVSSELQMLSTNTANTGFLNYRIRTNQFIVDTNGSERMRIDSSGQLMLGTTSGTGIIRAFGSTGRLIIGDTNNNYYDANTHNFRDYSAAIKMVLDSSGRLGIGSTSPSSKLVVADSNGAGLEIIPQTSNDRVTMLSYDRNANTYQTVDFDGSDIHFNIAGTEKARINSSGNVGIGTTSPAGLLEISADSDDGTAAPSFLITNASTTLNDGAVVGTIEFRNSDSSGTGPHVAKIQGIANASDERTTEIAFSTGSVATTTERMRIDSSGNVGIGTTSPVQALDVTGAIQTDTSFRAYDSVNTAYRNVLRYDGGNVRLETGTGSSASHLGIWTAGTERIRVTSAGNVGIGTTNPGSIVDIRENATGGQARLRLFNTDQTNSTAQSALLFMTPDLRANGVEIKAVKENADFSAAAGRNIAITFSPVLNNAAAERMRIDSSGHVLIGKTNTTFNTSGIALRSEDVIQVTRSGDTALEINRTSNDGILTGFFRSGVLFGSIGAINSNNLFIGSTSSNHSGIQFGTAVITPMLAGSENNGSVDIGFSNARFKDLYLSNKVYAAYIGEAGDTDTSINFDTADTIKLVTGGTERMRIDSNGNVGIGTTNPACHLDVKGSGNGSVSDHLRITSTDTDSKLAFVNTTGNGAIVQSGYAMRFMTNTANIERMRIDASGTVYIGSTSDSGTNYHRLSSDGFVRHKRSGAVVAVFDRDSTDGDIILIRKDGGTVGSIGTLSSALTIGTGDVGVQFNADVNAIMPHNISTGANVDASIDIGYSSGGTNRRFKDLYLSGAVKGGNGSASAPTFSFVNTTTMGMYRGAANQLAFSTNSTERMRIDSSGKVGIGTNSPAVALHAHSTVEEVIRVDSGNTGAMHFFEGSTRRGIIGYSNGSSIASDADAGDMVLRAESGKKLHLAISSTSKMVVNSSGNVGIGANSPSSAVGFDAKLQLEAANPMLVYKETDQSTKWEVGAWGGNYVVYNGNSERMRIESSGNVGIGTNSPSTTLHVKSGANSNDGAIRIESATSNVMTLGTDGTGHFIDCVNTDPFRIKFAGSEKFRIKSNGNVGINNTGAPHDLTVYNASGPTLYLVGGSYNDDVRIAFGGGDTSNTSSNGNTGAQIISSQSVAGGQAKGNLKFLTNGGDLLETRLVIEEAGNVGIGTNSPNAKLHISTSTFSKPSLIIDSPSGYSEGDLYVLHGRDVGTGIGFSSAGFGVNIQEEIPSDNIPQLRSNTGGLTSAGLMYVGADEVSQGVFGVMGVQGTAGTDLEHLFTVRSDGNVGIGTTSPITKTHIVHSTVINDNHGLLYVQNTASATGASSNAGINVNNYTGTSQFMQWENHGLRIGSRTLFNGGTGDVIFTAGADSEKMRIKSDGKVGIGRSSPNAKLDINAGTTKGIEIALGTSGVPFINFLYGATTVGSITTTGSATAYNTSSDQRLKDNIVDAPSASDDIDAIQVRSFDWKADGSHQKYGMVAQELQSVAPEAVSTPEDPEEMMGVDYSKLVPMLVKEIQSLRARVAQLEQ